MALSTGQALLAKQEAMAFLANAKPAIQREMKQLFGYLADHRLNLDLEFVAFADLTSDTVIADAANQVIAIYLKKQATSTAAIFKANDHATVGGSTTIVIAQELNASGDEFLLTYPDGWAQGTGFTCSSQTTTAGDTDSTSGDGPDGFVLIQDA
ncbi:hypothetical protein LCGC14_0897250 [marine sediment metagenome]|uniref:Uncharacterized protein n=1 Tax=marine sediment metagenome TaxID=412755 RepID=A0A0F9P2A6_9ZZZZ|nr:hypothetical protein [Phycisphaerae bacterium]